MLRYHPEFWKKVAACYKILFEARPRSGREFGEELVALIEHIRLFPRSGVEVRKRVRRSMLRRFHYLVYYRAHSDGIELIGLVHGMRDVAKWLSERLRSWME